MWTDGSSFDYTNWCPNEPNNDHVENCLELNWTGKNFIFVFKIQSILTIKCYKIIITWLVWMPQHFEHYHLVNYIIIQTMIMILSYRHIFIHLHFLFILSTGNRCWNDAPCFATMGYICARKLKWGVIILYKYFDCTTYIFINFWYFLWNSVYFWILLKINKAFQKHIVWFIIYKDFVL